MGLERSYVRARGFGGPERRTIMASGLDFPLPAPAPVIPTSGSLERSNGCCRVLPHSVSFNLRPGSLGFTSPAPHAALCWLPLCCVSASTGKGLAPLQVSQPQSPSLGGDGILGWRKSWGFLRSVVHAPSLGCLWEYYGFGGMMEAAWPAAEAQPIYRR